MKALCWTGGPKVLRTSVCREKAWGPLLEVANHQFVLCIGTAVSILPVKPPYVKLPIFSEFMENSTKIYEKLRSDPMDPKSALVGPKPISRTGGSLLKN